MAWLKLEALAALILIAAAGAGATLNLSADGDIRYRLSPGPVQDGGVEVVGVSVRKTFADTKGDRLTLFGLVEAYDNFSEVMVHELYARYKGPLGRWNVTGGRFGLPWGLLTNFSTTRLLYDLGHERLLGFDADNGVMVSGVVGSFDYAAALTQGYGAHHQPELKGVGLGSGRLGVTLGEGAEWSVGVSGVYGLTAHEHSQEMFVKRAVGGVDATAALGRYTARAELGVGTIDAHGIVAGGAAVDIALLGRLELNFALRGEHGAHGAQGRLFSGVTVKPSWFTLRGGYEYGYNEEPRHQVAFQLYRQFATAW
jgi:hypothetical protein